MGNMQFLNQNPIPDSTQVFKNLKFPKYYINIIVTGTLVFLKEVTFIHLSECSMKILERKNPKTLISKVKLLICESQLEEAEAPQMFHASKEILKQELPAASGNVEIHSDDLDV